MKGEFAGFFPPLGLLALVAKKKTARTPGEGEASFAI